MKIRLLKVGFIFLICMNSAASQDYAKGTVFFDSNKNRLRDPGENGIAGVLVSNGFDVVKTDTFGQWSLPVEKDVGLFVIKPAGYNVPLNNNKIPQYYYLHKPDGSPELEVKGSEPTGNLPESVDFPLWSYEEKSMFSFLLFGDTQARGLREVNYISHDVVEECIGTNASFGISLGDIVADDPNLFSEISQSIAQIGIPWYNVFGNHDHNRDARENKYRDETFERFFGPSTYAFEYGQVAFVVLNNIYYQPEGRHRSYFTDSQFKFVRNYLSHVPENKLIVLLMHIPIVASKNKEQMYSLLESRAYTLSISAHLHDQVHLFLDERLGWHGTRPHHHFINATVSGSWWCGLLDEVGIPHATMNDGAPNGYSIITFDGNRYSIRFKAARRPQDYQMNIYLPDEISQAAADTTQILVNVFAGSERSKVEMRFGENSSWQPLEPVIAIDPECLRMHELGAYLDIKVQDQGLDQVFGWKMDYPSKSQHMWQGKLPSNPAPGSHTVTIRTIDMFGQTWMAHRIIRVR